MGKTYNFRAIPLRVGQALPDGEYTIGRGADPRKQNASEDPQFRPAAVSANKNTSKVARKKKSSRTAAE